MYDILDKVNTPEDLKALSQKEILALNDEIRKFLVDNVTITGGHLASNLGIVELSVALLRVFNLPEDRVIYDVGHQSYVHKILTGRKDRFLTLRHEDGLSGFTKRTESEYDCFGAGHSSTSVSAALGFAEADALCGRDNYTVAVVGDGAFTGGMVYEALNNCSDKLRLIIILNDNEMSISKNVGNLSKRITKVRTTKGYMRFKRRAAAFFDSIPLVGHRLHKFAGKVKFMLKSAVYNLNFFENMGLSYLGPVDGNDYFSLENMLNEAKEKNGSVLVHIKTKKGMGYDIAEKNPEKYHGISPSSSSRSANGSFSSKVGSVLTELAGENEKICAITAAMGVGTGLDIFEKKYPHRIFDVGIAEAHAVTFFAGLSAAGMKPVFAVYSTFLQRAYDSLLHDVALQELGGVLCIDRAGLAHEDGATHHGIYDAAFLSEIDGITIYEPVSYKSLENMMKKAVSDDGLYAIRYSKGAQYDELVEAFFADGNFDDFGIRTTYDNNGVFDCENIVITYGRIASQALQAAKKINTDKNRLGIILLQTLSPLSEQAELISEKIGNKNCRIIFLEEGIKKGGVGMLLREELEMCLGADIDYKILAIDGKIPEQGELCSLYKKCGISAEDIIGLCREVSVEKL